jgi:hypothetical protein
MEKYDYFILIASSRSGHNYIRSNILSWLGTSWDKNDINYENWENQNPLFYDARIKRQKINSNRILSVILIRDYLNWLASYIIMLSENFYESSNAAWFKITVSLG